MRALFDKIYREIASICLFIVKTRIKDLTVVIRETRIAIYFCSIEIAKSNIYDRGEIRNGRIKIQREFIGSRWIAGSWGIHGDRVTYLSPLTLNDRC